MPRAYIPVARDMYVVDADKTWVTVTTEEGDLLDVHKMTGGVKKAFLKVVDHWQFKQQMGVWPDPVVVVAGNQRMIVK